MKRAYRFGIIFITDVLGVICLISSLLLGWLPGPGGVPLFILGLTLLSIHHAWARRYIDLVKKYSNRIGELIFIENKRVQYAFDGLAIILVAGAIYPSYLRNVWWQYSIAAFCGFLAITIILGNRRRWKRLKQHFKRKH